MERLVPSGGTFQWHNCARIIFKRMKFNSLWTTIRSLACQVHTMNEKEEPSCVAEIPCAVPSNKLREWESSNRYMKAKLPRRPLKTGWIALLALSQALHGSPTELPRKVETPREEYPNFDV